MTVSIVEVRPGWVHYEDFFFLPSEVYRGDPSHSAPFRDSVFESLDHPAFRGAQRLLLALEDGRPAARLVARAARDLPDASGRPHGLLGFFEALDRPDAARRLFGEAIAWLRQQGAGEIVGPMDGDTWHRYRLNVGPFERPPFLLEPYNPPYYPRLWESAGFRVLASYHSKRIEDLPAVLALLSPKREKALAAGYSFRTLKRRRFREELELLHRLSREIFRENFLYSDISLEEFLALYEGTRSLIDPGLVWFAEARDGSPAAFLFALPDRFRAVQAMRGRRGLLAKLRFLLRRGRPAAVNLKTLGVLPAHRGAGLGGALVHAAYRAAIEKGYRAANHCLMLDGNPSGGLDVGQGEVLRRYHLYRLDPGAGA